VPPASRLFKLLPSTHLQIRKLDGTVVVGLDMLIRHSQSPAYLPVHAAREVIWPHRARAAAETRGSAIC
jgi:hypothetical protein